MAPCTALGAIAGAAYGAFQGLGKGDASALLLEVIKRELALFNAYIKHLKRKNTYGNI